MLSCRKRARRHDPTGSSQMAERFDHVPIEAVRSYWDARPCNIRHSPREIGSVEYFQQVEERKYFVEPHIPAFADFSRWRGRRVLEIGCGIGTDTMRFARAGADITAVDVSERSLAIAAERARVFELKNIRFLCANAEELSEVLAPTDFDLIYSFGVLHHTPFPSRALRELRKYLAPDGTLKMMVYHRRSWKVLGILLRDGWGAFWKLDQLIARSSEAQTGCPVTYSYSRRGLARLLGETGYRVDGLFVDHIFPWKVSEYVQYRYRRPWYFRALPGVGFRWLERHFGWHLCVTARPGP